MNETTKTTQFLVAAAVSVLLSVFVSWSTSPSKLSGYGEVGKEFFEDLTDPGVATALRVVTYNESTASARPFTVEKKEGLWRIPSHHNYPADGKDRLAKIATSLIGVKRGAVASLVKADHERFGVIDPLDEDKDASLKGRGQRVTLLKEGNIAIADLIVGKEVEGQSGHFYCRRADEPQTYKTQLKIDISTKFSDWVESDLLKLERDNISRLETIQTKITPQGEVVETKQRLSRDKVADPWKLDGLNEETEEVNKGDIDAMITVLDNLKLAGIRERPKMAGQVLLTNELKIRPPRNFARQRYPELIQFLQENLAERGFNVFQDEKTDSMQLLSSAGELIAATNDGVRYHLNFGNVFAGSDDEIEKGISTTSGDEKSDSKKDDKKSDADKDDDKAKEDKKDGGKKSRYLFVRASFDETLLAGKPVEPMAPAVPEGVKVDDDGNVVESKDEKKEDAKKDEKEGDKKPEDVKDDAKKDEPKADPVGDYKKAMAAFKSAKGKFDADVKAFDKKVEDGNKKVKELNNRFGDWYYVISAEDFDKLRLTRDELVKAKEKKEEKKDPAAEVKDDEKPNTDAKPDVTKPEPAKPEASTDKPADPKEPAKAEPSKEPAAKPDDKKPAEPKADDKKPEEPKPEDKKAEEKKSDEKKADDKPAETAKPAAEGDAAKSESK